MTNIDTGMLRSWKLCASWMNLTGSHRLPSVVWMNKTNDRLFIVETSYQSAALLCVSRDDQPFEFSTQPSKLA